MEYAQETAHPPQKVSIHLEHQDVSLGRPAAPQRSCCKGRRWALWLWRKRQSRWPADRFLPSVYAVGRIEWRFPTASIEKEFAQATGRVETTGLTDRQALHAVLSQRQHPYLVRQLCWVLTIADLETYILMPHDPADYDLLVEAVRPAPSPADLDVIGVRGPLPSRHVQWPDGAPSSGLRQIYSFDRNA